ncbi:MAG: agmatine deiminase family protein [Methylomicrobium sp.]
MNRFPAEWEKQAAVLIAWPDKNGDFGDNLDNVEESYRFIAETISRHESLIIVCKNADHQQHIETLLQAGHAAIRFIHADYNDIWVRDTAFLTAERNGETLLLNFRFNGWGGKYEHRADNALNQALLNHAPFSAHPHLDIDMVLEGGSVESDGQGTILTTQQCLLNPNRNPNLNRAEIEAQLQAQFGARRVLWIDQENLDGDDTDAHIDTLARFCSPDTIAYTSCNDPSDKHYSSLKNMEAQLQSLRTADGRPYQLIALDLPKPIFDEDGRRLPANYANFLIINGAVMVPVYEDPMDDVALDKLADCFPQHEIIATPCRPIVQQYGSLHCMTMQFPSGMTGA